MERRLAAILAADMVGHPRLTGEDEALRLTAYKALRLGLFALWVAEYHDLNYTIANYARHQARFDFVARSGYFARNIMCL